MKRLLLHAALFTLSIEIIYAQPGNLDSSFGKHGTVNTYLGVDYNYGGINVTQILSQPDGTLYITQTERGEIAKRLPDGSADKSYGFNGFSENAGFGINEAAIQPDGKIVAAGSVNVTVRPNDYLYDFALARFNADGTPDSSFSGDGKLTTDFNTITKYGALYSKEEADVVAVQKDGKIVVAGISNNYLSLARYKPDGSLDSSFDNDGLLTTDFYFDFGGPNFIAIQKDGKIVVTGNFNGLLRFNTDGSLDRSYNKDNTYYRYRPIYNAAMQSDGKVVIYFSYDSSNSTYPALARYNADGSHDTTFSQDGKQVVDYKITEIALQNDGKIAVICLDDNSINDKFTVRRYNADGSPDNIFGTAGKQIVNFGVGKVYDYTVALTTQSDGKIIVGGGVQTFTSYPPQVYFGLARYNADGSADSSFGNKGKLADGFRAKSTVYNRMAVQKDEKIIAAGSTFTGGTFDFAIVRYDTTGELDNTFSTDGIQTTSFTVNSSAKVAAVQNDGKIVAAGELHSSDYTYNRFVLARYNANGSLDSTFSGDGKLVADSDITINSIAIQKDGKIVVAGLQVMRYNTDGSLDKTFGTNGKQSSILTGIKNMSEIVIQDDGKIVVSGVINDDKEGKGDIGLARLNADGTIDKTFSDDGKTSYAPGGFTASSNLIIQKDGKIVVAGNFASGGKAKLCLARFDTDGSVDTSFNGIKTTEDNNYSINTLLAIQPDGKIVAFGSNTMRFNKDGSIDSSFNINAKQSAGFGINDIAISNNKLYAVGVGNFNGQYGGIARYLLDDGGLVWPSVSFITPADNTTYLAPAAHIKLSAAANDKDGTISKVAFYTGTTLLHTETEAPYGYVWRNVALGNYTITAKATDNSGNVTTSAPVHIFVVANQPPTVSITKPSYLQSFAAPAYIHFEATAADPDGRITKVEFYNDATLLNTQYKAPYSFTWKQDSVGKYFITAVATDNWGATNSDFIYVKVVKPKTIVSNRLYSENGKTALNDAFGLRLSPNPANNIVTIRVSGLQQNKPATLSIMGISKN